LPQSTFYFLISKNKKPSSR